MKTSPSCFSSSIASGSKSSNEVFCKHNYKAILKRIGKGRNVGKNFYGCFFWPNGCGLFILEEDLEKRSVGQMNDYEKPVYVDKLKKFKLKMEMLRMEVMYFIGSSNCLYYVLSWPM